MATEPQADLSTAAVRYAARRSGRKMYSPGVVDPDSRSDDEVISIVLEISPELDEAMEVMALDLEGSKSDVFVGAMALFQLAIDAKKGGKRVCIADDDLNVETEITGFGPLDDDSEIVPLPDQD